MIITVDINELKNSIQAVIALTKDGDEIVLEENGEPIVKVIPFEEPVEPVKKRILGLGSGKGYFMSEDFDDELPDEFWGFDKEL
jgi:Antitoxin of toxin-antitoxin stability system